MVGRAALLLVMSLTVSNDIDVLVNRSFTIFYCIEVASSQQLRKPANGILCKLLLRLLIMT